MNIQNRIVNLYLKKVKKLLKGKNSHYVLIYLKEQKKIKIINKKNRNNKHRLGINYQLKR